MAGSMLCLCRGRPLSWPAGMSDGSVLSACSDVCLPVEPPSLFVIRVGDACRPFLRLRMSTSTHTRVGMRAGVSVSMHMHVRKSAHACACACMNVPHTCSHVWGGLLVNCPWFGRDNSQAILCVRARLCACGCVRTALCMLYDVGNLRGP